MDTKCTVAELFKEFLNECSYLNRVSPRTIQGYSFAFKRFSNVMPEIRSADLLSSAMMTEFFKRLHIAKSDIKVSTIRSYWNKLSPFFEWLVVQRLIGINPFNHLVPPKVTYEDVKSLDGSDIRKLYAAIVLSNTDELLSRRNTAMLSTLVFCGLRLNEFVSLELGDLDLFKKIVVIRGKTSKSRRTRTIPIHPTLYFHLQEYLTIRKKYNYTTAFLFVSKGRDGGITKDGLKHWINRLKHLTGVNCYVHRFRHTFACNLAMNNVNAAKIQKLLGHSSLEMTMTYLRSIHTDDLIADIEKLSF